MSLHNLRKLDCARKPVSGFPHPALARLVSFMQRPDMTTSRRSFRAARRGLLGIVAVWALLLHALMAWPCASIGVSSRDQICATKSAASQHRDDDISHEGSVCCVLACGGICCAGITPPTGFDPAAPFGPTPLSSVPSKSRAVSTRLGVAFSARGPPQSV